MTAVWNIVVILVILCVIEFHVSTAVRHRHHKTGQYVHGGVDAVLQSQSQNAERTDLTETIVHGRLFCDERPMEGVRPYLMSPEYPKVIINICATNADGWYRLTTGTHFEFHEKIYLTIRHQCEMEGLAPMAKCAVPYYTTEIKLDVSNTSYINNNIELSKMKAYSSADCLY